jgi:drug/metabolite transporter (DMT)-like permease
MPFLASLPILVLILFSVALNASAQIFLRLSARSGLGTTDEGLIALVIDLIMRPALLGGLACYGLSVLLWIYVLSRAEASYAYPFLGLGFVVVALAGWLLLGETMSMQRFGATALIVFGVVWLART